MKHKLLILFGFFSIIMLMSNCVGNTSEIKSNKMIGIYDVDFCTPSEDKLGNMTSKQYLDIAKATYGIEWFFDEDSVLYWGMTDGYGLSVPTKWEIQNNVLILFERCKNGERYPSAYLIKKVDGDDKMELYASDILLNEYGSKVFFSDDIKSTFRKDVKEHEETFNWHFCTLTRNKEKEQEYNKAKEQEEKLKKELEKLLGK